MWCLVRLPFFVMGYELRVMSYELRNMRIAARNPIARTACQRVGTAQPYGWGASEVGGFTIEVWHYEVVREIPCVARRFRWSTNKWSR